MNDDDNDGQMIFGDLGGLKLPDICLTGEEKPRENLTQESCPDRGSNPGPLRDRRACCRLAHSGGLVVIPCLVTYQPFENKRGKILFTHQTHYGQRLPRLGVNGEAYGVHPASPTLIEMVRESQIMKKSSY